MTIQEVLDYVTPNGRSNVTFTALVTRVEGSIAFMQDSTAGLYWTVPSGVSALYPDIQVGNIVTIQADCELYFGTLQIAYNYTPDSIILESSGNEVTPVVITDAALGSCQLQSFTGTVTDVVSHYRYPYFIVNNGIIDLVVHTDKSYSPEVGPIIEAVRIGQGVTVTGNSFYRTNGGLDIYPNQIYMIDTDDVQEPEFQMKKFTGGMFLKQKDVSPKFTKIKFLSKGDYESLVTNPSVAEPDTIFYKSKEEGGDGIPEAPIDGNAYGRQDGEWTNLNTLIDNSIQEAIEEAIEDVLLGEV